MIPILNFTLEIQSKAFFGLLKFCLQSGNITSQKTKIKVLSSRSYDMEELFFNLGKMRDLFKKKQVKSW